jgi:hypothetical protein
MQRFGCRAEDLEDLLNRCSAEDVFTHATGMSSVRCCARFAAASRSGCTPLRLRCSIAPKLGWTAFARDWRCIEAPRG